ncbi:hypothetical protein BDV36DRAFT_248180 [Aspergillus pseudocaelatus]|uniref:Uncharacterized protein n=1 Tax=Aspergillus pseudocaelatus TaxID=1825620 RepID=A0ABQ6WW57_9EURO|nr:hypothetical protein BDV36DRAFT_248180 [Aspergillus pseudocaelatus]
MFGSPHGCQSLSQQCSLSGLLAYHSAIGYVSSSNKWIGTECCTTYSSPSSRKSTTWIIDNVLKVSLSFIILMVDRTSPRVSKSFQGDTFLCSLRGPGSRQNRYVAICGHVPNDQCSSVCVLFNCNMNTQEMGLNSPDQSRHLVVDDDCASDQSCLALSTCH